MRQVLLTCLMVGSLLMGTSPVRVADRYRFRVAEGIEALGDHATPHAKQLIGKPLMVLISLEGTHWMFNGCPAAKKPCEWLIDDHGGVQHRTKAQVSIRSVTMD